jgi:hypothetical protein
MTIEIALFRCLVCMSTGGVVCENAIVEAMNATVTTTPDEMDIWQRSNEKH